ncbi:family 43 glycosylhydrolase [Arachidicoccus sp.]|uniref:family 43 glycosylhydrolase n=1 Tax=Arachidicoccus sp. TaxID=1872624 RepID=UPI003D1E3E49
MKASLLVFTALICSLATKAQTNNFSRDARQLVRFSTSGNAVDAHDGEIAFFNGTFYLYGTSYDCGFEWGNKNAPFCGFKVYTSKDLVTWVDRGTLFDAQTKTWQCRCNGNTYGCFRPHVIYNKSTQLYVLWINVYDNSVGFRVFTSPSPVGPFKEVAEPHLAVNSDMPVAGLNNGDHDTFVDDDGTAYIAYTDWRSNGAIDIEKLDKDYLTGTGEVVKSVTKGSTEAPCLFKRNDIYYLLYSDPNCGYCSSTGTSYRTAPSPLGPWSDPIKISDNSCGGQPSFVSVIKMKSKTVYLFGSDLWNNGAKNEALANYFWSPLFFDSSGRIKPIHCMENYTFTSNQSVKLDTSFSPKGFSLVGDVANQLQRSQTFGATGSGMLTRIDITLFKKDHPNDNLIVAIYKTDSGNRLLGKRLFSETIDSSAVGWSAKSMIVQPHLHVDKNEKYTIVLHSDATKGCYGVAWGESVHSSDESESVSKDGGKTFALEPGKRLRFKTYISSLVHK